MQSVHKLLFQALIIFHRQRPRRAPGQSGAKPSVQLQFHKAIHGILKKEAQTMRY